MVEPICDRKPTMPIPHTAASENTAPRRLLRDVVYDQMFRAALDGTFVPGERLSDDALSAWLGTSRTPIREAIAQLAAVGIVEVASNRWTRVAAPDPDDYRSARRMMFGLSELAARWAVPALGTHEAHELGVIVTEVERRAAVGQDSARHELLRMGDFLAAHAENSSLSAMRAALTPRARFLALAERRIDVTPLVGHCPPLRAAVARRDGDAAASAIRDMAEALDAAGPLSRAR